MEKLGVAGNPTIRPSGMMRAIQEMFFKGSGQTPLSVSSQKPSYSGSTGSFKQNQRREHKITAKRRQRRLDK